MPKTEKKPGQNGYKAFEKRRKIPERRNTLLSYFTLKNGEQIMVSRMYADELRTKLGVR